MPTRKAAKKPVKTTTDFEVLSQKVWQAWADESSEGVESSGGDVEKAEKLSGMISNSPLCGDHRIWVRKFMAELTGLPIYKGRRKYLVFTPVTFLDKNGYFLKNQVYFIKNSSGRVYSAMGVEAHFDDEISIRLATEDEVRAYLGIVELAGTAKHILDGIRGEL